jgi:hypothetical protein
MDFFKRIFDFDEMTVARKEQRLSRRFDISPLAPLRGQLQISGLEYPVSLRDLSSHGAGVLITSPADIHEGISCQISIIAKSLNIPLKARIHRPNREPLPDWTSRQTAMTNDAVSSSCSNPSLWAQP